MLAESDPFFSLSLFDAAIEPLVVTAKKNWADKKQETSADSCGKEAKRWTETGLTAESRMEHAT
jgi:hypothetical protein